MIQRAAVLAIATLIVSSPVSAQIAVGGQVSLAEYGADQSAWGVGGRVLLSIPLTGLQLLGTFDEFRLDCGSTSCRNREAGVNLLWSLPFPSMVDPYLGAGVALKAQEELRFDVSSEETGINLLAGMALGRPAGLGFHPFAEVKYELRDRQAFFSAGVLLYLF